MISSVCDTECHLRIDVHLTNFWVPFVGHDNIFENVRFDISVEELLGVLVIEIGSPELISKLNNVTWIGRELRDEFIFEQ